jgi:hypothetical protein
LRSPDATHCPLPYKDCPTSGQWVTGKDDF